MRTLGRIKCTTCDGQGGWIGNAHKWWTIWHLCYRCNGNGLMIAYITKDST